MNNLGLESGNTAITGQNRSMAVRPQSRFPVAVVGYSYRLPGGLHSDEEFWRLLCERGIIQEPVTNRYGRGYCPVGGTSGPGRFASPYEGLIRGDEEKLFDRSLFGLSQNEMNMIDPQMRMLLSCSWETFERSGWDFHSLYNSPTGVFIGAQVPPVASWRPMHGASQFDVTSISLAMLANRISYHFNLLGPSTTYCTACSASLTALHAAINSFKCGDCEQAIIGSVNYLGSARLSASFNALGVISPDGKCHSFDADANGYMRSEGAFIYAIKPLEAAEGDGDYIHAVIESTAVNAAGAADGSGNLAQGRYITAPTRHSQVALMQEASRRAGYDASEFDYIEAHATGTVVGDRIEGNAIIDAFGGVERNDPLRISSVKSNVGHMEAAAFHCALLKVMLMMRNRTFAPTSKNFLVPNPDIDFDRCPMRVQTACEPFPERPVVIGINSFGFGGANGHCVVREYRPVLTKTWSIPPVLGGGFMVPLSARNTSALARSAQQLHDMLEQREFDLHTLVGNLARRRTHFLVRTSFAVRDLKELSACLSAFAADPSPVSTVEESGKSVAMVFSGQGTQWQGCGRTLYDADPVFRRAIDAIEKQWREHSNISLRDVCFSATQEDLNEVQLAQPAIFMIQCALVELLKTWGIYPDCVIGHSSGEVAAAYACGALSLPDATRLVYHRSTLQQRRAGSGRMLAVGLDRAGVELILDAGYGAGNLEIACVNAPANTVICGPQETLRLLIAELDRRQLQNVLLPGNIAFHSAHMDQIEDDARKEFSFLDKNGFDADVPFISSVTGEIADQLDSCYWWSNIRQPVLFAKAIEFCLSQFRPGIILEVAPHSALQPTIRQCLEGADQVPVCIPTLMRDGDASLDFQEALGALFRAGAGLDFVAQYPRPEPISRLLPGHPRDDQTTINVLVDDEMFIRQGEYSHGPIVGHKVPAEHILLEARLSEADFPWLSDHRVHHAAIMPAAGYIELILEALEGKPVYFEVLEFLQPCPVPKTPVRLQTALWPDALSPGQYTFSISSRSYEVNSSSELHCRGKVCLADAGNVTNIPERLEDIDTANFESSFLADDRDFYERLETVLSDTFQYGPFFRTIKRVRVDLITKAYLFDVEMDTGLWESGRDEGYIACPPLLDGGLQIFLYHLLTAADLFAIPQRAEDMTFLRGPTGPKITCHVTRPKDDWMNANERGQYSVRRGERSGGSISFYDSNTGDLIAHIGEYTYFTSNPRWNDLTRSKHRISWQPKFLPTGQELEDWLPDGEVTPATLITALGSAGRGRQSITCRIIEFADNRDPSSTVLKQCIDDLEQSSCHEEYWLVGDSEESTQLHFDAFNQYDAVLRFASIDPTADHDFDTGLLRVNAAKVVFLHGEEDSIGPEHWELASRVAVDGGLVMVVHDEGYIVNPGCGWMTIRTGRLGTILQMSRSREAEIDTWEVPGPRWVLGERNSWAEDWASLLNDPDSIHVISEADLATATFQSLDQWPGSGELQAIDFFCGTDPEDPTGEKITSRFISFAQSLVSHRIEHGHGWCRLNVVTNRAVHDVQCPRGSAVWGAVRSMALEVGEEVMINFRLVDLGDFGDLEVLAELARSDQREREIAIRNGCLWVPRMTRLPERYLYVPEDEYSVFRLVLDNPGQVSGLEMKTCNLPELGPEDVEIDIAAAALNFRDIMVTLGLLPALAYERSALGQEVGMEASGVVRRVGAAVAHFRTGDEVAFIAGGCIGNRMVVNQGLVFLKPDRLGMEEAASVLSVHVTAYYALIHLARLRRGQRVLIHSALGGVGQAAIALARFAGAEIYATAGSEERREQLLNLGVKAAFDSHSIDWYDELMETTGGEGVDVVLNSLAGHHIELCLQALRAGGWHCEIGKVDIYADNKLGMRVFRKNLRFVAIDVDRLIADDPHLARGLSQTCLDMMGRGELHPLPLTVFPYSDYARAIRLMMTGQHKGKIVLKSPQQPVDPRFPIADIRPIFDPEATYLVTGGLGGFGLRLLPYLVSAGACHLTLMDRDPELRRNPDWIRRSSALAYMDENVVIDIVAGDVSVADDVERCISGLNLPLKGVFHLSGELDDRLLDALSPASVSRVFAAKAKGALNLDRATRCCSLDHFVMLSSTSSVLGNPGQINYSAANGFLDGLAAYRQGQGLPGLSYNMAAVADAGMAARSLQVLRIMRAAGLPPVSSDFAIANLDYALRAMPESDHLITALFDRPSWTVDDPDYMRIGRLIRNVDAFESGISSELTVEVVVVQIAKKVAELCGHEEGSIEEPLSSFGLTSISVAELGAFIQAQFNYRVSALELMTSASALSLATDIVHGNNNTDEDETENDLEGQHGSGSAIKSAPRRVPSTFANSPGDHFPRKGSVQVSSHADRQPCLVTSEGVVA